VLKKGRAIMRDKGSNKTRANIRNKVRERAKARRAPGLLPSNAEVKAKAVLIREFLGSELLSHYPEIDRNIEDSIRFNPVARVCEHMRQSRGLSLKEAAAALKVPQYRLRAIEAGTMPHIEAGILLRYLEFLKIMDWFELWKSANARLARMILGGRGGAETKTRRTTACRAKRTR